MATRSNIAIILKEEDKEQVFSSLNERLEKAGNRFRYNPEDGNVLQIYCHWDGYPTGVGMDLLTDFNSYEDAIKLILEGDHSTPYEPYSQKGEDWEDLKPSQLTKPRQNHDYLYVFKDGKWKMPATDGMIEECIDKDGYCTIEDYLDIEL